MQELDNRVNKLDNLGLLTNGSFSVKETLQSLFERVNAKDEGDTLSVPFSLRNALSNLEKRIEALENACKHNYTYDWVYTYIKDRQHEKIKRCSNCDRTYGETEEESCNKITKYIYNNNQTHYSLSTCENCGGWLEPGATEVCVVKNYTYVQLDDGVSHIKKEECDICNGTIKESQEPCTIVGDECTECHRKVHSHNHIDEVTTAPTCENDGVKTWTCSCGDWYTEGIPALGHSTSCGICSECGKCIGHNESAYCEVHKTHYCPYCQSEEHTSCIEGCALHPGQGTSGYCDSHGITYCTGCYTTCPVCNPK